MTSRGWKFWVVSTFAAVMVLGTIGNSMEDPKTDPSNEAVDVADSTSTSIAPAAERSTEPTASELLFITDQKDGDSWVASDGREYRLGMIDTPEVNEQCSTEAAAFTREFLASGFTTDTYSSDTHGRQVAEVFDESGESLNVALAKSGLGGDRYLEQFRHENPDLAQRLDDALASAPTPACRKSTVAAPLVKKPVKTQAPKKKSPKSSCMAGYSPCLPVVADLDCPEIGHSVTVTGSDPYRLDRDKDGVGCD